MLPQRPVLQRAAEVDLTTIILHIQPHYPPSLSNEFITSVFYSPFQDPLAGEQVDGLALHFPSPSKGRATIDPDRWLPLP